MNDDAEVVLATSCGPWVQGKGYQMLVGDGTPFRAVLGYWKPPRRMRAMFYPPLCRSTER